MPVRIVCAALLAAAFALPPRPATAAPVGGVPILIAPSGAAPGPVEIPFLFEWTAVAPGRIYNVHVAGRTVQSATSLVGVSYELEISDRGDVASHVLFDTIVDDTSYLFLNDPGTNAFTQNQPPDTPLPAGTYYWRVRAIFTGGTSEYAGARPFVIASNGIAPQHALGLVGIEVAGIARERATSPVVVRVENVGNFPESGASLEIFADGVSLGTADVPPLAPGQQQNFTIPWTPADAGYVVLSAALQYADDDVPAHAVSQTALVLGSRFTATGMSGTLERSLGDLVLLDASGQQVATIVHADHFSTNLGALAGKRVRLHGSLYTQFGGFVLVVDAVDPSSSPLP